MDYSRPELAERLAADYASGALRGPARRRLEALIPAHPVLRDAVRAWEARLMPLTQSVPGVVPRPAVWNNIATQLGWATAPRRWWQGLPFWRGLSAFATVSTLALSLHLILPSPAQPPMVVVLEAASPVEGVVPARFVAGISGDGRAVVTQPLTPVNLQADRALELWAVPMEGAPRSLGLISAQAASVVKKGQLPAGTQALAVSLEPTGGSPTGAPTGPILFVGKLPDNATSPVRQGGQG